MTIPEIDWAAVYGTRLWTYHLHYMDYALDIARAWRATGRRELGGGLERLYRGWVGAVRSRPILLEPYPVAVRILNTLKVLWLVEDRLAGDLVAELLQWTGAQLRWLERNLEYHLMANHLQKDLQALVWGGLAFEGAGTGQWRAREPEFWHQLREQVLPDGGHFERSPMYHAQALVDFAETLTLARAAGCEIPGWVEPRLLRMGEALRLLSRPDGSLHLFNDAANGQVPEPRAALSLFVNVGSASGQEPTGAVRLPDTGYHAWIDPDSGVRLLVDAGPPGPSCQPGHAHCDMLSFELDLGGRPVVVDAGVHGYDDDPYREYVRSTRAHNTVMIGGREQHEVWATFRMARRGEILEAASGGEGGAFRFQGACRSYHDRRAAHRRTLTLDGERLSVMDRVEGAEGAVLRSWIHLHPDFAVRRESSALVAQTDAMRLRIELFGVDESRVAIGAREPLQGWHCPEFGMALPATAIELRVDRNDGREFGYRLFRP